MRETSVHATQAEAIAQAVSELAPGDEVIVHAATCKTDGDNNGCTCEPYALIVPPAAEA